MTSPFRTATPLEQLAAYLGERIDNWGSTIMATVAELTASLDTLTSSFTDYSGDVTAALQALKDQQAAMQSTLDAALANDATDAATISDLRSQLAAMQAGTDEAILRAGALNDAIKAADVQVDRPATPETPA